jgi:hypothetical protein
MAQFPLDIQKSVFQAIQIGNAILDFPQLNEDVNGKKCEDDEEKRFIKHKHLPVAGCCEPTVA